jgi:hypothetical protein
MSGRYHLRASRRLRIFCPVAADTLRRLMAGELVDSDPALGAMQAILRGDNPLGDFGPYRGVVELHPGWEAFEPTADASPTLGHAGAPQLSPTVVLTVHIPTEAPDSAVERAIEAIMAAHPWEVPVIELDEVKLLVRAG